MGVQTCGLVLRRDMHLVQEGKAVKWHIYLVIVAIAEITAVWRKWTIKILKSNSDNKSFQYETFTHPYKDSRNPLWGIDHIA